MAERTFEVTRDGENPLRVQGYKMEVAALSGSPAVIIYRSGTDVAAIVPFDGLRHVRDVTEQPDRAY